MLSYRHAFHAGNHADILKHICLVGVLESMVKKDKNFTAIDTHAGAGLYSLDDERALKTGETESGIIHLSKKLIDFSESDGVVIPKVMSYSNDSHLYREGLPTKHQNRIYY